MQLQEIDHPTATVFRIKGRLDASSTTELEQKVLLSLDRGITHLIMDFSELEYINSAGLRILVMSYQRLSSRGGQVMVCGVRDYIAEIFEISGYNRIFVMCQNAVQAMEIIEPSSNAQ
ncbi:MAG: STAS domain-containing protein [Desulfomicrobium sp.]|nr:STAS domain-containing protein [Pseudomonadota bacterium]MBV1711932.1 STAS domain-containing protein [Desulfomicrobium sp.]MBU4571109.1 STAS domain-containing protein [Pseudomonadota bacterium]MBU4593738.1 STAS domain-containing protein [Pseudomonadota bacterium]MBV1719006.1 STAS domain-containing protein [Desulfomicrobium sp.]